MKVCVFCGSSFPHNEKFVEGAKKLGEKIGKSGNELVFGGSDCGIMRVIAESSKKFGAKITSVQLDIFNNEPGHTISYSDELIVTSSFQERKLEMLKISDVFVIFPGGTGTLDEFSDVLVTGKFYFENKKIILLNIENYYEFLIKFLQKMKEEGFADAATLNRIQIVDSIEEIIEF